MLHVVVVFTVAEKQCRPELFDMILFHQDMAISHPIHRKKLGLAIEAKKINDTHPMGKLDYLLVLRWLDDLGLPQYKDAFADARIDGRTLNFLTTVSYIVQTFIMPVGRTY